MTELATSCHGSGSAGTRAGAGAPQRAGGAVAPHRPEPGRPGGGDRAAAP